jgi:hypothetical protein
MQVQTLELYLRHNLQDLKMAILQAIDRNASLRTVAAKLENSEDLFDDHDKMMLRSYLVRNKRNKLLAQWIENPTLVRRAAWPEYLYVAQTTGPDTVYRILQALTNVPVSWFEVA